MGNWWSILGGGAGFLKITIINFPLRFLFDVLNMCRPTERFYITCYFSLVFSLFHFIKSFFNSVSFDKMAYLRGKVHKNLHK